MNKFPPTSEQSAIIESAGKEKSIVISARAGCAKTDTGVRLAEAYPNKRFQFIVFNKKNAEEFRNKLPSNAIGSTCHSFCNRFIKKSKGFKLDTGGYKVFKIIFNDIDYNFKSEDLSKEDSIACRENLNSMKELIGLAKVYFIDPKESDMMFLIDHYGISFSLSLSQACSDAVRFLKESDDNTNEIDFNDMVRFPIINNSIRSSFDYFFLDEAQDNTPIRNELLRQMHKQGCSVICCGDEFQAIYGFAGADCDSMKRIQETINPIVLPLTTNFRCGSNIIKEAQKLVPDIKAWDKSPEGQVIYNNSKYFLDNVKSGDMVLSRMNRTIIPECFKLIKRGMRSQILGRDFAKMLIGMIKDFKATSIDDFYVKIDRWLERQLKNCKSDSTSEALNDRHECLKYFADNSDTVEEILTTIEDIFSDEKGVGVTFSTIHRSKGMEENNVFILDSANLLSSRPGEKPWMTQQNKNVKYVGVTRSRNNLIYIN